MNRINIFGIPNCDSTKKALDWFKENKIDFVFHDYKKEGIDSSKLKKWCRQVGWEKLLNKKSTTWRKLQTTEQESITDESTAIKIMLTNTSIVKRPVIDTGIELIIGFKEETYSKQLK